MPSAGVTPHLEVAPAAAAPPARPACPEKIAYQAQRLLNKRAAASVSTEKPAWLVSKTELLK